ncbi:hypothetical protein COR50_07805 [Chitinophaga caeni]|uniref:RNA polymerase subunit sigma-70 n=1 Tax=Chitinophaga caeni TaxID=2029983 RepID=A0A291QT40_9BACT|nr:sigma-70 family RNA polymerase sigma factor [Chitinophaga caeni]ATL47097.1 hypothetical protein COR50_07805 [Chitinophaga caeni]
MEQDIDIIYTNHLKKGDFKVFEAIFNTYWESLYLYAAKILDSEENARDIIQDLFVSLWERRTHLDIQTNIRQYLFSATRKLILRKFRDDGLKEKHLEKFIHFSELRSEFSLLRIEQKDIIQHFQKDLQQLPVKERQVFEWYHFDELSIREIAQKSGTAEQTVRNQLSNAYRKAKPLLHKLLFFI